MESHLQSTMRPHLDLTYVKLNNTQVELKNAQERIRKLEQQVKFKDEQEAVRKLEEQLELKNAQETIRKLEEKFHTRKMLWKINEFSRIMRGEERKKEVHRKSSILHRNSWLQTESIVLSQWL